MEADSSTCISAQANLDSNNILSNNVAVGGAGGGVYALTVSALSISCSVNGNETTYTGGDLTTSWPYHDEGCPTTWTGNSASDGGYGNGLATGFRQLKEADTGSDDRTNVNSNSVITVVLHMIDYLGTIMTRGSYETTGTTVAVNYAWGGRGGGNPGEEGRWWVWALWGGVWSWRFVCVYVCVLMSCTDGRRLACGGAVLRLGVMDAPPTTHPSLFQSLY